MEPRRANGTAGARDRRVEPPIEKPVEPSSMGAALPECERLAGSKVDWSDYPDRTDAREQVSEILHLIEDALATDDEERLEHIASFADSMQGLRSEGDRIRWEMSRVEKWARRLPASKRPELTALKLIFDLELSDPRYGAIDAAWALERLRECKAKGADIGAGNKGLPATLAAFMVEAGAHNVTDFKGARSKIENARTSSKKGATRGRPSEFRRLREK